MFNLCGYFFCILSVVFVYVVVQDESKIMLATFTCNIPIFDLIPNKNIPTKLFTWPMKCNILLTFPFTCSLSTINGMTHVQFNHLLEEAGIVIFTHIQKPDNI